MMIQTHHVTFDEQTGTHSTKLKSQSILDRRGERRPTIKDADQLVKHHFRYLCSALMSLSKHGDLPKESRSVAKVIENSVRGGDPATLLVRY